MNNTNSMFYDNDNVVNSLTINALNNKRFIWVFAALSLLMSGAYVLGRFFCQPKQLISPKFTSLTEAALMCEEQTQIQNAELRVITDALNNLTQESRHILNDNKKMQIASRHGYFQAVTEKTPLIETRDKGDCKQLLAKLRELMGSYPECSFEDDPCIESIELYLSERIKHHSDIMEIAVVLLPNISSLIREARFALSEQTQKCGR